MYLKPYLYRVPTIVAVGEQSNSGEQDDTFDQK